MKRIRRRGGLSIDFSPKRPLDCEGWGVKRALGAGSASVRGVGLMVADFGCIESLGPSVLGDNFEWLGWEGLSDEVLQAEIESLEEST